MNVLLIVTPVALALAAVSIAAFRWANESGQFDDLDTPSVRFLIDDFTRDANHKTP